MGDTVTDTNWASYSLGASLANELRLAAEALADGAALLKESHPQSAIRLLAASKRAATAFRYRAIQEAAEAQ